MEQRDITKGMRGLATVLGDVSTEQTGMAKGIKDAISVLDNLSMEQRGMAIVCILFRFANISKYSLSRDLSYEAHVCGF